MEILKHLTFVFFALCSTSLIAATYTQSSPGHITFVAAYSKSSAPGDVLIRITAPHNSCVDGYYVLDDSPNKDSILSIALAAYHAKTKVRINGFDAPNWRGSSSANTCEIEGIVITD